MPECCPLSPSPYPCAPVRRKTPPPCNNAIVHNSPPHTHHLPPLTHTHTPPSPLLHVPYAPHPSPPVPQPSRDKQTLTPVTLKQLAGATQEDDAFILDNKELTQVSVVGCITEAKKASTNITLQIEVRLTTSHCRVTVNGYCERFILTRDFQPVLLIAEEFRTHT